MRNPLYNFSGAGSVGGLIFDAKGNLYGTTFDDLVFELTPKVPMGSGSEMSRSGRLGKRLNRLSRLTL